MIEDIPGATHVECARAVIADLDERGIGLASLGGRRWSITRDGVTSVVGVEVVRGFVHDLADAYDRITLAAFREDLSPRSYAAEDRDRYVRRAARTIERLRATAFISGVVMEMKTVLAGRAWSGAHA